MKTEDCPMCSCAEFWESHPPECPVRRHIETLQAEIAAKDVEIEGIKGLLACCGAKLWGYGEDKLVDEVVDMLGVVLTPPEAEKKDDK